MPATPMTTWLASWATNIAPERYTCVMHCFSSGAGPWRKPRLILGFYLSMSGIAAFPKSSELREIFATRPLSTAFWWKLTAPYLAPPPNRGKRNEPCVRRRHRRRRCRGVRVGLRRLRRSRPKRNFEATVLKGGTQWPRADLHHPGLRVVRRCTSHWRALGRLRSRRIPKNTRRRCSMLVERLESEGHHHAY